MGSKANRQRTVLVVLAAVGGGLLLACGAGVAVYVAAVGYHLTKPPAPRVYERDELRQMLMGKSQEEVIRLLGKPDRTGDSGGNTSWMYLGVSHDRISGRDDTAAHIYFKNGRVSEIHF